jgi:hypothetical protein
MDGSLEEEADLTKYCNSNYPGKEKAINPEG